MGWIKVKIVGLNPWQDFQTLFNNMALRQSIKDEPCKTIFTTQGSIKIEQGETFYSLMRFARCIHDSYRPFTRVAYQLVL